MSNFVLKAEKRNDIGKGASRRLRHSGKTPAVIYGGNGEPLSITLLHSDILNCLQSDSFYSQVIEINVDGEITETVVRDLQRHPYRPIVMHIDFQRIVRGQEITVRVPIHFINEDKAIGVKAGGIVNHYITDLEISCRASMLPASIDIDIANLNINEVIRLEEVKLPEGVSVPSLAHGEDANVAVVSIHTPKGVATDDEVVTATEEPKAE